MNLRDLRYIVAVAELKNFSKAAEHCFVSQPTLSSQIKKTEEYLGVTIFERSNKHVLPTKIGHDIIVIAKRILQEEEHIKNIAKYAKDPFSGTFTLGAFPTLASYIFPTIIPLIRKSLPKIKIVLVEEKTDILVEQLKQGTIDAALLALPVFDDKLIEAPLFDDPFVLATSKTHHLSKLKEISQDSLMNEKLLLLDEGHCLRDQSLDVCQRIGMGEEDMRATSLETLRQMVKAGTGITLMPNIAIHENDTDISYIPFKDPKPARTIGMVYRKTLPRTEVIEHCNELIKSRFST